MGAIKELVIEALGPDREWNEAEEVDISDERDCTQIELPKFSIILGQSCNQARDFKSL
ncbi:hypothetical protein [Bdellovibrio sp. HCB209]|uniref:hypothetical protein n=1 Tax=Bdellovibrio sp. HCB209 TaxID=3394354 RepID=UPI0039B3ADE2